MSMPDFMPAVLKTLSFLLLAAALAALAALVPAHLRSVDPDVLEWLGSGRPSTHSKLWELLNAAQTGPAHHLLTASQLSGSERNEIEARRAALLAAHPNYRISGGPAPAVEAFLARAHPSGVPPRTANAILSLLLPRSARQLLSEQLAASSSNNVAARHTQPARSHPAAPGRSRRRRALRCRRTDPRPVGSGQSPAQLEELGALALAARSNTPTAMRTRATGTRRFTRPPTRLRSPPSRRTQHSLRGLD